MRVLSLVYKPTTKGLIIAAGLLGILNFSVRARADFNTIPAPNAAYTSSTENIPITIPDYSTASSITDGTQRISFSIPMTALTVPTTWNTWASPPATESATPRVLATDNQNSVTLTFATPVKTAGFEAEPDPYDVKTMTATFYNGSTVVGTITLNVYGKARAQLFAGASTSDQFTSIVITSSADFAIAQLRYQINLVGVDISSETPTIAAFQDLMQTNGKQFVYVDAWGGHSTKGLYAGQNLFNAIAGGFNNIGAYCFLNFDNLAPSRYLPTAPPGTDQRGDLQVNQAFANVGPIPIAFMVIDVEPGQSGTMSQNDRVKRIADAVQAVRNHGVPAIIYTNANFWTSLTGNSVEIAGVSLWETHFVSPASNTTAPDLDDFSGFGTWSQRIGLQYQQNIPLSGIKKTDLNICRPSVFSLPPASGQPFVIGSVQSSLLKGTMATVVMTFSNLSESDPNHSGSDALALRIINATIQGGASLTNTLPVKMNTLPEGQVVSQTLTFKNATAGRNILKVTATWGGVGTEVFSFRIVL